MIFIGGKFTDSEMNEIKNLGRFADKSVTDIMIEFVTKQAVSMQRQGISATHMILGQSETPPSPKANEKMDGKKWWQLFR